VEPARAARHSSTAEGLGRASGPRPAERSLSAASPSPRRRGQPRRRPHAPLGAAAPPPYRSSPVIFLLVTESKGLPAPRPGLSLGSPLPSPPGGARSLSGSTGDDRGAPVAQGGAPEMAKVPRLHPPPAAAPARPLSRQLGGGHRPLRPAFQPSQWQKRIWRRPRPQGQWEVGGGGGRRRL